MVEKVLEVSCVRISPPPIRLFLSSEAVTTYSWILFQRRVYTYISLHIYVLFAALLPNSLPVLLDASSRKNVKTLVALKNT